jgi:hypothetical protein
MSKPRPAAATVPKYVRLKATDFKYKYFFEAYGVRFGVESNSPEPISLVRSTLPEWLPEGHTETDDKDIGHRFRYFHNSRRDTLKKNGETLARRLARSHMQDYFMHQIRLTAAEFAVGRVFVHAGVVGWKGKAIVIPGKSFSGKTTLTAELVRRGAEYYSDEYAVLDEQGLVHPFAKTLSIRGIIDDQTQLEHTPQELGGKCGEKPIPVGVIVVTKYKKRGKWEPKVLSAGAGTLELIKNALPIRNDPDFSMRVLSTVAARSRIIKTDRGEAAGCCDSILSLASKA